MSAVPTAAEEAAVEAVLVEPYNYIAQMPGKDIRSKLIQAFNLWLKIKEDKLQLVRDITKMLHNASLLIDDIQDNSKLRRGIPVAHSVFGVAQTINCANYIYFQCMALLTRAQQPEAFAAFTEQLLELHRGQGMDIYWRDAYICPTEEEYRRMVLRKTGGLFTLALRLMQLFSEDKRDYLPLLNTFGLYFQIRDDLANLTSDEYTANKSFCEDITEGKFSFPIIHCIRANPTNHQLQSILKQRTSDVDLKRHCLTLMESTKSFEYTRNTLNDLEMETRKLIAELGGNDELIAIVDHLCKLHRT